MFNGGRISSALLKDIERYLYKQSEQYKIDQRNKKLKTIKNEKSESIYQKILKIFK